MKYKIRLLFEQANYNFNYSNFRVFCFLTVKINMENIVHLLQYSNS